jgi:hypothetical protein
MLLSVPDFPARPVNAHRGREFNLSIAPYGPVNNSALADIDRGYH